jgi:MYXO-CTERM domain-containing protein
MSAMSRRLTVVALIAVVLAAWTAVASAHTPDTIPGDAVRDAVAASDLPAAAWQTAETAPSHPWYLLVLVLVLAMLAALRRRPRAAIGLALVLCLAVFAFESGVHSVHHLSDNAGRASCAIATAGAHVSGAVADPGTGEPSALASPERLVVEPLPHVEGRSPAAHHGRAPPLAA